MTCRFSGYFQRLDQKTAQLIHLQRVTMEHNVCVRI